MRMSRWAGARARALRELTLEREADEDGPGSDAAEVAASTLVRIGEQRPEAAAHEELGLEVPVADERTDRGARIEDRVTAAGPDLWLCQGEQARVDVAPIERTGVAEVGARYEEVGALRQRQDEPQGQDAAQRRRTSGPRRSCPGRCA